MQEAFTEMLFWIREYYGDQLFLVLTVVSGLYLFSSSEKNRKRLIYPVLLIVILIVNPLLYQYVFSRIIYWRLFWMVPESVLIALAVTRLMDKSPSPVHAALIFAVSVAIIVLHGNTMFATGIYKDAENPEKVSAQVAKICDIITETDDHPRCIVRDPYNTEVRIYNGDILQLYGREGAGYILAISKDAKKVHAEMESSMPDYGLVLDTAMTYNCNFIVTHPGRPIRQELLDDYSFAEIYRDGYCIIYYGARN